MAALERGTTAPDFTLPAMDGKQFSLREALARGPVLAAFFKISCPTCQYALPFLQRIYEAHGNKAVTIVGISQNTKKDTAAFIREYGITFPRSAGRHQFLSGFQCLRTHQRPHHLLDRKGRRNRDLKRGLGEKRNGRI